MQQTKAAPSKRSRRRTPVKRRQTRLGAQRAAHARDFVAFLQSEQIKREIPKAEVVRLYKDYTRLRELMPLSEAQLFRALPLADVVAHQVDITPGDPAFDANQQGRQRQTVYILPRRRLAAPSAVANRQAESLDATSTPDRGHTFADADSRAGLFVVLITAIAVIGGATFSAVTTINPY